MAIAATRAGQKQGVPDYPGAPPNMVPSLPMNAVLKSAATTLAMALLVVVAAAVEAVALPGTDQATAPPPAAPAAIQAAPEPVEAAPVPAPAAAKSPEGPATTDQLQAEVCALREDMRMLQSTLDLMVNKIMADLREENEQLRMEVRRLNALRGMPGMTDFNAVPRPAGSVVDQVLSEPVPAPALPPPPPFKFTVVREWGRSAEEAQKLGADAQSLKGLIGVVPAGSLRADVEKLARDLRHKYDGYDNINVEVFDDRVVAREFAANKPADPEHRVLSVSRHKASDRDAIVLLINGKGEMISADPNAPPPPQQPDNQPTLSVTNPVSPGQAKRPKAADAGVPIEDAAAAPQEQNAMPAPEQPAAPGKWQKSEKKAHTKGSSRKNKGAPKEEPVLPERQRPIPEGSPMLVPHEPTQPEPTVIVAPPGEPVTPETAAPDNATAAPEQGGDAGNAAGREPPDKPSPGPKSNFGPKSKKNK